MALADEAAVGGDAPAVAFARAAALWHPAVSGLFAQRPDRAEQCPLSGAKQTWLKDGVMSAYDPKRTSAPLPPNTKLLSR
jgi:hypothetical protein